MIKPWLSENGRKAIEKMGPMIYPLKFLKERGPDGATNTLVYRDREGEFGFVLYCPGAYQHGQFCSIGIDFALALLRDKARELAESKGISVSAFGTDYCVWCSLGNEMGFLCEDGLFHASESHPVYANYDLALIAAVLEVGQ